MKKIKSIFDIEYEHDYLKNKSMININELDENGENALFSADASKCEWLIRNRINVNHLSPYNGCSALYTEFEMESDERTKILIEGGININALNKNNENALFYVHKSSTKFLLIENGINIMQINSYGNDALYYSDKKVAEVLIKKGIDIARYPESLDDILDMISSPSVANLVKEEKDKLLLIKNIKEEKNIIMNETFKDNTEEIKKIKRI